MLDWFNFASSHGCSIFWQSEAVGDKPIYYVQMLQKLVSMQITLFNTSTHIVITFILIVGHIIILSDYIYEHESITYLSYSIPKYQVLSIMDIVKYMKSLKQSQ